MQRVVRGDELGDRIAGPADGAVGGQHEMLVRRIGQLLSPGLDLASQRLLGGSLQGLGFRASLSGVGREGESIEATDRVPFNDHFAGLADFRIQNTVLPQAPHQYTGTTINETLREPFMKGV